MRTYHSVLMPINNVINLLYVWRCVFMWESWSVSDSRHTHRQQRSSSLQIITQSHCALKFIVAQEVMLCIFGRALKALHYEFIRLSDKCEFRNGQGMQHHLLTEAEKFIFASGVNSHPTAQVKTDLLCHSCLLLM